MSALKEIKPEIDENGESQLELPFGVEVATEVVPEIPIVNDALAEVIALPRGNADLELLEEKKISAMAELERLNQYTLQKQKKLQEAKSFIEQYERVVVHKKRYIDEVEVERNAIEKEIVQSKSTRDKKLFEIEELKEELVSVKKQFLEEKNNLQTWEIKIHEKRVEYAQAEVSYKMLMEKKEELYQEFKVLEEDYSTARVTSAERKSEIILVEEQLMQLTAQISNKQKELENLNEVLENFLGGHKQIEAELVRSIDRLKSEESTWRLLVEERSHILDKLEIQINALHDEVKEKSIEHQQVENLLSIEKNKLLHVGDLVQKEQFEATKWEEKVHSYQSKLEELKQYIHQLESTAARENAEVEMLRNRRHLEEQEQFKLQCSREHLAEVVREYALKKVYVENEIKEKQVQALIDLEREVSLKKQEEKSLRTIREEEFRSELQNEKKQMKEIFWSELDTRLNSLSEEVTNYLSSCIQVNLDIDQKEKLHRHVANLAKYYHGLDVKSYATWKQWSSFIRLNQHFMVLGLFLAALSCLGVLILK